MISARMFKRYAVIEHGADNALIELLLQAAQEHLAGAGVVPRESSALYDTACYMIAHDWYNRRGAAPVVIGGALSAATEHAVNGIIWKLKLGGGQDAGQQRGQLPAPGAAAAAGANDQ